MRWRKAATAIAVATALTGTAALAQAGAPSLAALPIPTSFQSLEFAPQAVAWVTDSRLVLTDIAGHQLVVAQLGQEALRRVGREGGGPGEFRSPSFAIASPSGAIVVDDIAARRLSEFDSTFRYVRSTVTPGATLRLLDWSGNRVRLVWISFGADASGPAVSDVDLAGGKPVDRFLIFARDSSVASPAPGGFMKGPSPFVAAAPGIGGQIVVGDQRTYRLVVFDSTGAVLRRFGRPEVPPVYRTPEETAALIAQARRTFAGRPIPADLMTRMEKSLREEPKPRIGGGIAVDGAGRVWAATTPRGGMTGLDVFSPAGRFLGTRSVSGRVSAVAIRGSTLAVVAEQLEGDAEGTYSLNIYRIR